MAIEQIITWRNWKNAFEPECLDKLAQMEESGIKPASIIPERNLSHLSRDTYDALRMQTCYLVQRSDLKEFLLCKICSNDPTVNCMIEGLKNVQILTERTKYFGLSILSLSIILRCDETARLILKRIGNTSDINSKDKAGWTALHHGSVCAPKDIRRQLKSKGAFKTVLNSFGATPSSLKKMTTITKKDLNISLLFRGPSGASDRVIYAQHLISSPDASAFFIAPECIIKTSKIASSVLYDIWKMNNEGCHSTARYCNWGLNENIPVLYEYNPKFLQGLALLYNTDHWETFNPQVSLRTIEKDDKGHPVKGKIGYGIFAAKKIDAKTRVERYAGFIEEIVDDATYSLHMGKSQGCPTGKFKINASRYRSLGACFNHSFPNAAFVSAPDGNSWVSTITEVAENEEICVSYGPRYFTKHNAMVELRPKALEEFGKTNSLNDAYQILTSRSPENDCVRWQYILVDTPVSFLRLILKGIYSKEDVARFFSLIQANEAFKNLPKNFPVAVLEFCFNLVEKNKMQAQALADYLHLNGYFAVADLEKDLSEIDLEKDLREIK